MLGCGVLMFDAGMDASYQLNYMMEVFSVGNVDVVYGFVENEIIRTKQSPWIYQGYELSAEAGGIIFKKNGYTLARLAKTTGLITLPKLHSDSIRIEKEVTSIFCSLLQLAQAV